MMVRVTSTTDPCEALLLRSAIEGQGIPVFIENYHCGNEWMILGAIRMFVNVPEQTAGLAREVVERFRILARVCDDEAVRRRWRRVLFWFYLGPLLLGESVLAFLTIVEFLEDGRYWPMAWGSLISVIVLAIPLICCWLLYRDLQLQLLRIQHARDEAALRMDDPEERVPPTD